MPRESKLLPKTVERLAVASVSNTIDRHGHTQIHLRLCEPSGRRVYCDVQLSLGAYKLLAESGAEVDCLLTVHAPYIEQQTIAGDMTDETDN